MSTLLLIISLVVVISMLVVLNYESMINYYTYNLIQNIRLEYNSSTPHLDLLQIGDNNHDIPFRNFKLNEDGTLTISFSGGKSFSEHFDDILDFNYTHTFNVNQTFAWRCIEQSNHTHLGFYKYLGQGTLYGDLYVLLWHYEGKTKYPIPCNYPDLIINSIDLVGYDNTLILEILSKHELDIYRFFCKNWKINGNDKIC